MRKLAAEHEDGRHGDVDWAERHIDAEQSVQWLAELPQAREPTHPMKRQMKVIQRVRLKAADSCCEAVEKIST